MVAVVIALVMTAMLGFAALTLDAGMLFVQRTQLQKAVDAAALAGAFDLWPGDGTNSSVSGNAASDAARVARDNGLDPSDSNITSWVNQSTTVFSGTDAWRVTVSRRVPLVFAPVLGIPNSTVTVSAVALNSPLGGCTMPDCILPYAIWAGNNPSGSDNPNTQWCNNQWAGAPNPCAGVPNNLPSGGQMARYNSYDWNVLESQNQPKIVYRDNSWASDVVWPNQNNCYTPPANNGNGGGGGNGNGNGNTPTPVCTNANWVVGTNNNFKGFFNNYNGVQLTAGTIAQGVYSQGGNSSEPWDILCQITARQNPNDRVAIMPLVDWAQQTSGGNGVFSVHIKVMVAIQLDLLSGCSGGNAMGAFFTGTVLPRYDIPRGNGNGPQDSPVHVLKLWQ